MIPGIWPSRTSRPSVSWYQVLAASVSRTAKLAKAVVSVNMAGLLGSWVRCFGQGCTVPWARDRRHVAAFALAPQSHYRTGLFHRGLIARLSRGTIEAGRHLPGKLALHSTD